MAKSRPKFWNFEIFRTLAAIFSPRLVLSAIFFDVPLVAFGALFK